MAWAPCNQCMVDELTEYCPIRSACCNAVLITLLLACFKKSWAQYLVSWMLLFLRLFVLMLAAGWKRVLLCAMLCFSAFYFCSYFFASVFVDPTLYITYLSALSHKAVVEVSKIAPFLPALGCPGVSPAPQSTRLADDRKPSHYLIGAAQGREGRRAEQLAATTERPRASPRAAACRSARHLRQTNFTHPPSITSDCSQLRLSKAATLEQES